VVHQLEPPPSGGNRLTLTFGAGQSTMSCRGLLLDMDGVLIDSMNVITRQLREWAAAHRLDPQHVVSISHGCTNQDVVRAVAPWLDAQREAELLVQREIQDTRGIRATAGALALIEALPAWSWAIVTSADPRVAHVRLGAAGVVRPEVLVTASEVHRGKPDPEGYLLAASWMGVAPQDCVVVEDAPAGIAAARAAGCRVVALTRTAATKLLDGDVVIASLADMTVSATQSK
jgi:sugar-phosphatase